MPPEPLPWDRKDFFKERKHERSESLGSVARWRDSSHHGSREFNRWGSADFRRPPGHGKQGGWHLVSEDSGHGCALSRSSDKMLEEENSRPSVSRGDGKYGRSSRENRGSFSQRDWRGHSWDSTNGSLNMSRRPTDVTNDQRSVDDMLYSSHPHSHFVNTWDQLHLKDQHNKMGGVNGLGTGQRCDRANSLGSIDWKPFKWPRTGSLSSRGSGFSHSSSSRSIGGADSNEARAELHPKNETAIECHSGDGVACVTSSAPSEEMSSRKKRRLNWGEGLAKYEKKKIEGPDASANKDGLVLSTSNMETCSFLGPSLVDKSPKVAGFSDCASPATPSSVACSSSPGVDDKLFGKAANIDNDVSTLSGPPGPGSQNHLQRFSFSLEKLDDDTLTNLGSSLIELLQSDDPSSVDSDLGRSSAINKLLIWKANISKVLEVTEAEIDSLENELKSLKSEFGDSCLCPSTLSSLVVGNNAQSCEGLDGSAEKTSQPEPLQIVSSADPNMEKMLSSFNLHNINENGKEEDIDSPGTATSRFVEPPPLTKVVSSSDIGRPDICSEDLDVIQSTSMKVLLPCTTRKESSVSACGDGSMCMEVKDGTGASCGASLCPSTEDILYNAIISSNKEFANRASDVFDKLLPKDCCKVGKLGSTNDLHSPIGALIKDRFSEIKRFARFKERVITIKFKALHHLWKEDTRLLSVRKCRPKSHKKLEVGKRSTYSGHQKHRSSIRSRFPYPAGNLSLVSTSEMINFTRQLLSDSQVKVHRNTLKMPALILDEKEKMVSRFITSNGLVEDPLAFEKERLMINPWTSEEKEIFMEKLAAFGKDFRKIASFLDHKTTADCVEFYYKNHKSDYFEKIKKKNDVSKLGKAFSASTDLVASGKKWNREINVASLEILSAASVMAGHADSIIGNQKMHSGSYLFGGYGNMKTSRGQNCIFERSSSFDILGDERETVAADVLAGICGSLSSEAMSSCITSSVDPVEGNKDRKCPKVNPIRKQPVTPDVTQNVDDETCSDESCGEMDPADWTDEEKSAFLQAVSSFGKDFVKISRCVGTRSQDQCKVFFSKARKCLGLDIMRLRPENVGSPVDDDANGGGSDTDDACVIETGSVIGTDKSGAKTDEDLPLSLMNTFCDEINATESRNLSTNLNESKDNGTEVVHEDADDVYNIVSDAGEIKGECKVGSSGGGDILYSYDKSGSVSGRAAIIMSASVEVGKDKSNKLGGAVTELVAAAEIIDPCQSNSFAEDKLVSEISSGDLGNELEGQKLLSARCPDGVDDKHEADTCRVVELKGPVIHDTTSTVNASVSCVSNSCTGLSLDDAESHPQVCLQNPHISAVPMEIPHTTAHSSCVSNSCTGLSLDDAESHPQVCLQNPHISAVPMEIPHTTAHSLILNTAAVQCEKTASQDRLSSTCDFQGSKDRQCHSSMSNDDCQRYFPGHLLDRVEAASILQGYPLQMPIKNEVNGDVSCSSSATELPLLSQKIEQASDDYKTQSQHSIDSEKTSRNGDVKLFGKILTNPSSTQKPNMSTKGSEENGSHHPKLSSKSSSLKFSGHHNADGNSTILKFDHMGLENVPMRSYGYWDGNKIRTGFPSLPDSAILLAKYPDAFSNYSTSSAKSEQQSLQSFAKNNEQHLNGASVFTTREVNSSNGVIDYPMFRRKDGPKVQPFVVDLKHRQDVFSEMQRRNGFEAISSLQQQGRGMVGINGVGRPGILVGGSRNGVSDPVAAIKMHYSNSDQYGGQTGSIMRGDESWGGQGDLGR